MKWTPEQNEQHFVEIFKCILMFENYGVLVKIMLKYAPNGLIEDKSGLIQLMAWRQCWPSCPTPQFRSVVLEVGIQCRDE